MRGPEGVVSTMSGRAKWEASCARDEAEQARQRLAEMRTPRPSRSVIETWLCPACRIYTRPSLSRDGHSCELCGRGRPGHAD